MVDGTTERSTLLHLSQRLRENSVTLATAWLERVYELLAVSPHEVFPSNRLLDHVPAIIEEIARSLEDPDRASIERNQFLQARAAELGELRHMQHASLHQLLREYRMLAELLDEFIHREVARSTAPAADEVLEAMRRVGGAVRVLQQHAADAFVANYTQTLERQTGQLRQFSRLVSHEIRQPLAVLQVLARALPVRTGDMQSARMMDIFHRSVARLSEVTGKLERLARVTRTTDLSPNERVVALTEVAHAAAAQLSAAAAVRGVDVRVHRSLPVLRLDPARTELVFVNLIANGIKFSDPHKSVRYIEVDPGGGDAPSVIVRDNGVGMAPARLQTIFREFVRAHAQDEDDVRAWGLGLGLSIVRESMDLANGSVRVDSLEGRGTSFKLTWPKQALATAVR
jgi:signal transduction histidine kinase